jgi:hypothetical protein
VVSVYAFAEHRRASEIAIYAMYLAARNVLFASSDEEIFATSHELLHALTLAETQELQDLETRH